VVPVLFGRVQTRLFLLAVVGSAVTALIVPALPVSDPLGARYRTAFTVLAAAALLGIGWELVYHVLMQFRWEKDWPSLFGLLTGFSEGIVLWFALQSAAGPKPDLPWVAFAIHFTAVWLAVWLAANGPMRVSFLRWRFRGGRLI
jgi:hypothetical protein